MTEPFKLWTSPNGLVGIEIDKEGCWLRMREHPADQWDPPEQMLPAGGNGTLLLSNAGIEVAR